MDRICPTRFRPSPLLMVAVCLLSEPAATAIAGGGPENVLLVVNRSSPASLTIANHYVRLRQIPAGNVLTLPWDLSVETIDIDTFRQQLLTPVFRAIEKRRLTPQIDYVVYSSDFPWGIVLTSDLAKFLAPGGRTDLSALGKPPWQPPKGQKATGSINGLTYLWQPVMGRHPSYLELTSNRYMRRGTVEQRDAASLGFRSTHQFGPGGELRASGGRRYLLSTMLGVTAGRGNSLKEVLGYLRRSAAADGTRPRGTIYFVENKDIRSKVRHGAFPAAVRELKKLGVAAEVVQGKVPVNKDDVQGVMMGTAYFGWKASGCTILPGAVCEHFTSFGTAPLRRGGGQRHGRRAVLRPAQVSYTDDSRPLRPGMHAGRGVLPVGLRTIPTADRGRPALPPLGKHPPGDRRRPTARGHPPGQLELQSLGQDSLRLEGRSFRTADRRLAEDRVQPGRSTGV